MKNNKLEYWFLILISGIFFFSCSKDKGYYAKTPNEPIYKGNMYDYLKSKPGVYDSLIKVIDRIELQGLMRDSFCYTICIDQCEFSDGVTKLKQHVKFI
ncbi:hypothetical protein ACFX5U_19970 [Sphingobacterium sp. SG20118]|uniref:hypothetical protein n=1 Tax=Sphingobacterium sp. SG20118 TaxID=3367156 RepID=UPI0037DFC0B9